MSSGFSVKVKMNPTAKILKDHGLDKNGRVVSYLRDRVDALSDPFVPFKTGGLKRQKAYPSPHEIKYTSPYSHYMYNGKKAIGPSKPKGVTRTISNEPLKYHTSGTGPKWDRLMMQRRQNDLIRDVQNFIKKGL